MPCLLITTNNESIIIIKKQTVRVKKANWSKKSTRNEINFASLQHTKKHDIIVSRWKGKHEKCLRNLYEDNIQDKIFFKMNFNLYFAYLLCKY